MDANVEQAEQERKIENILRQLEKLDQFSRDAEMRLQLFTERLFGRVHEGGSQLQESSPTEAVNICETISWHIMNTTAAITSISLEIDSMMRELPEKPKTERKEEF